MMPGENVAVSKAIDFALAIIAFCELLEASRKYVVANQLLKCGTSIGANIHEAQNAESKADFIHKFKIAAKELEETSTGYIFAKKLQITPMNLNLRCK